MVPLLDTPVLSLAPTHDRRGRGATSDDSDGTA
jgi:hypothetical protein